MVTESWQRYSFVQNVLIVNCLLFKILILLIIRIFMKPVGNIWFASRVISTTVLGTMLKKKLEWLQATFL